MNPIRGPIRAVQSALAMTMVFVYPLHARESDIEHHIEHFRQAVLPPVTVQGEPVPTSTLEARMAALRVPGLSVAVIHGGKLEWARGFGVTRIGGPPVTTETLFQAASISKIIAATAVLKQVQTGRLDLDADVSRYLEGWKLPASELTHDKKVTLRGLLSHSAGIGVSGFDGYAPGSDLPTVIQVLNGESPAKSAPVLVTAEPGKSWSYSGGGYMIIQQILTDVTGRPYVKLVEDSVLHPWGMHNSSFEQPLSPKRLARTALPYRANGVAVPAGPRIYPELAAAGLWTTPSDLARSAIGLQAALSGHASKVLSQATARSMVTPQINKQALGWVVGGNTPRKYFSHGGVNDGYRCFLLAYENGDGAALMTNGDGGSRLIMELLRTLASEYNWPDLVPPERILAKIPAASFDRFAGAYRLASGATATFWLEGEQVRGRLWGQATNTLFPSSPEEYFDRSSDARWIFATDAGGRVSHVTLIQAGREQELQRLDEETAQSALDLSRATEQRFKTQTAAKGGETALRRLLASLARGTPDLAELGARLAMLVRVRLPELRATAASLGPVKAVAFKGVEPNGADRYEVTFEHDALEYQVLMDPSERIEAIQFSPPPVPL